MSVCLSVGTYVASRHNFPTRTLFIFLDWIKLPVLKYLAYDFFRSPKKYFINLNDIFLVNCTHPSNTTKQNAKPELFLYGDWRLALSFFSFLILFFGFLPVPNVVLCAEQMSTNRFYLLMQHSASIHPSIHRSIDPQLRPTHPLATNSRLNISQMQTSKAKTTGYSAYE